MKSKKNLLLILIFSIAIIIPVIINPYYKGHDTNFHVANINVLANQISWKNPMAKEPLAAIANNFGYGTRLFYPPLPHLIAAYLTKLFHNVTIGMRITQWLTIFLSGITFFYLADKIFKNKKVATIASFFYMSAPYHLAEIFIRDAFSEMFVPIAIPLIVLGLIYLVEDKYRNFFLLFTTGYTLMIYSHLAMSIYFTLIILVAFFLIYFRKIFTWKKIAYLLSASVVILCLTSPFWVGLLEHKIKGSYAIFIPYFITGKGDLRFSAIGLEQYLSFFLPHNYNFIRYHLQIIVTIGVIIGLIFVIKNKIWKSKKWISILLFTLLSFIMTTSLFPWYYTPDILQTLQFPWRLCIYVAFGSILIASISLKQFEKSKYFSIICIICAIICLGESYYNTFHVSEETVDISNINYNLGMGNQEEYLPEKVIRNYEYYKNRSNEIVILAGEGKASIIDSQVPNLAFEIQTNENLTIELPRLYYLGYSLKKDSETIPLMESNNGFLKAQIQESGTYQLTYSGTSGMILSKLVSIITLIIGILILVFQKKNIKSKFTKNNNNDILKHIIV